MQVHSLYQRTTQFISKGSHCTCIKEGLIRSAMLSQMCSNRNNPEEFVTANAMRLPSSYSSLQDVVPDPWANWGRGEIGASALFSAGGSSAAPIFLLSGE